MQVTCKKLTDNGVKRTLTCDEVLNGSNERFSISWCDDVRFWL